jgi:outer membrane protein assembly factor BamD (BamD/ComL family)
LGAKSNDAVKPLLSYYIASTRYQQLRYLEEVKSWDEYFAKGNDYRDDIVKEAGKSIDATSQDDPIHLYSRLIIFQFHKDLQDAFVDAALSDLVNSTLDYAKLNKDSKPVKETADRLLSYGEKAKAKELYKIYAQELVNSNIKDEALKDIALGFYKDDNLELAENFYDIYIERIAKTTPKDKLIKELIGIALDFSYKDSGPKDMFYAEKIFKKIEEIGGMDAFNEELIYLRGFNLEKSKEFRQAKDMYLILSKKYPDSKYADEITYKVGLIYTYALRDAKSGREYFDKLADKDAMIPQSLASLYQLGLLKQWEGDSLTAKAYYNKLIEKSKGNITDTLEMAQARLKEIEGSRAIEYNLKVFMDTSLKEEFVNLDTGGIDLEPNAYQPKIGQEVDINSSVYLASSGCFNVELQYLWSYYLGDAQPSVNQSGLKVSYKNQGTKLVGLVLVSPTGISGRTFDLIDAR